MLRILSFFFFSCFVAPASWAQTQAQSLNVVADPWCPFTCSDKDQNQGLVVDVLRAVFKDKYKVQYSTINWARALQETRAGKHDLIAGSAKADAPDFLFPTASIISQRSCFFVHQDSKWKYSSLNDLEKIRLGTIKDYTYGEPVDSFLKKDPSSPSLVSFGGTDALPRLVQMLALKRIDVLVEDESVFALNTHSFPKKKFKSAGCIEPLEIFVAFSPAKPELKAVAEEFNQRIQSFKKSDEFNQLLKKYSLRQR